MSYLLRLAAFLPIYLPTRYCRRKPSISGGWEWWLRGIGRWSFFSFYHRYSRQTGNATKLLSNPCWLTDRGGREERGREGVRGRHAGVSWKLHNYIIIVLAFFESGLFSQLFHGMEWEDRTRQD